MSTALDPSTTSAGPGVMSTPPGRGWVLAGLGGATGPVWLVVASLGLLRTTRES